MKENILKKVANTYDFFFSVLGEVTEELCSMLCGSLMGERALGEEFDSRKYAQLSPFAVHLKIITTLLTGHTPIQNCKV